MPGIKAALQRGKIETVLGLVRDGLLTVDEAVKRSKLTEEEFRKLL